MPLRQGRCSRGFGGRALLTLQLIWIPFFPRALPGRCSFLFSAQINSVAPTNQLFVTMDNCIFTDKLYSLYCQGMLWFREKKNGDMNSLCCKFHLPISKPCSQPEFAWITSPALSSLSRVKEENKIHKTFPGTFKVLWQGKKTFLINISEKMRHESSIYGEKSGVLGWMLQISSLESAWSRLGLSWVEWAVFYMN